ncbi:MAG: DUF2461 domain-containing protein [Saprospiraceae bacterium]|nr:DUF2461 domain-containing protein [Saprospiraceae bacterium]
MVYFTERTQKFLADLEVNNNRDWFAANKEIFKVHVEQPFEKFVTDLIEPMKAFFPNMEITSKESIFRIYRDVRFGKDKSPYKIHMSAIIAPGGRKDFRNPGFYIELKANEIRVYSGIYEPDANSLTSIRKRIATNSKELDQIITNKKFKSTFGEIRGARNKVLPKDLKIYSDAHPLIFNKAFYYFHVMDEQWICSPKLLQQIMKVAEVAMPMNHFLSRAIN